MLNSLAGRYAAFRVFLSAPMEANRPWSADWGGLDVVLQKTRTTQGTWRHPRGFSEPLAVHVPLDTIGQLRRFAPDLAVSAEMGARTLLALLYCWMQPNARLLVWVEAADAEESGRGFVRYWLRKLLAKFADGFLALGSNTVQYLTSLGVPKAKISKVAYTTQLEPFAALPLTRPPEQARRLLFCGQLIERKGLEPFLRALSRWAAAHPAEEVQMALAGDGPLRDRLSHLSLPTNVTLEVLGSFSYSVLPEVYGSAGIFVLPTLADTWAVVVNEAMASGLPVLGSVYAQAVTELIEDGRNGWTFRPDDEPDMDRALEEVMKTEAAELDRMRSEARRTALNLTPERIVSLIEQAIEQAVKT